MHIPPFDDLEAWSQFQPLWHLRDDTTYLNHGSFGPPPEPVRPLDWSGCGKSTASQWTSSSAGWSQLGSPLGKN